MRETWGMGGMGNEGMRDFFLKNKSQVKPSIMMILYDVSRKNAS